MTPFQKRHLLLRCLWQTLSIKVLLDQKGKKGIRVKQELRVLRGIPEHKAHRDLAENKDQRVQMVHLKL